ncbi:hypothetical protein [Sphingobacterium mizutaii]|uniref:hypothetical protein n=1 Tax=Sphingobacterium mizutaii TaxID=1010 RepID=UPI001F309D2D|nr:hypothetical protein [Sphingobacterium mizutaii]
MKQRKPTRIESTGQPCFQYNRNQPTKDLFEFITKEHSQSSDLGLFSLLLQAQADDYEEVCQPNEEEKEERQEVVIIRVNRIIHQPL